MQSHENTVGARWVAAIVVLTVILFVLASPVVSDGELPVGAPFYFVARAIWALIGSLS